MSPLLAQSGHCRAWPTHFLCVGWTRYDALSRTLGEEMRRRKFIAALGSAAAWPLFARAQQQAVPVIGLLSGGFQEAAVAVVAAIKQGLLDAGYVEGKNVAIEYRWANAQYDQLPTLAADLVRQWVAVIIAETPVAALAAKHATTSIPIVFSLGSDPVRDGLVASLNRPGGNITGATFLSNLLSAKRLDLFQRFVPDAKVIAVLLNPKSECRIGDARYTRGRRSPRTAARIASS